MSKPKNKKALFERRRGRIRSRLSGTRERPRLTVYRSNQHLYVQLIDDTLGKTIASVHSREIGASRAGVEQAANVGARIAEKAKAAKIESVVFDRSGYRYHGRVKAVADGARKGGLKF